jgi:hypothetical protein
VLAPAAVIASLEAISDRETAQASDAASSGKGVLK